MAFSRMATLMSTPRRAPITVRTSASPRWTSACVATTASSTSTHRRVPSADPFTTASTMRLPAYAMPSGSTAAASVSAASITVDSGDERHTSATVARVYDRTPPRDGRGDFVATGVCGLKASYRS